MNSPESNTYHRKTYKHPTSPSRNQRRDERMEEEDSFPDLTVRTPPRRRPRSNSKKSNEIKIKILNNNVRNWLNPAYIKNQSNYYPDIITLNSHSITFHIHTINRNIMAITIDALQGQITVITFNRPFRQDTLLLMDIQNFLQLNNPTNILGY